MIYILGIIYEYLVIINVYNGDLFYNYISTNICTDIEYSIWDIIILIYLFINYKKHIIIEFISIFLTLIAHIQWYLHNPFSSWPKWWIHNKTENDIRHRTEYYDTHTMCFTIYSILFFYSYNKKYNKELLIY